MTQLLSDSKVSSMVISTVSQPPHNMTTFFAIPGASGKVRLKLEMPEDAYSVMIRYKTSAWASGDGIATGTLVATLTENHNLANEWYEVSGLTNGTAYYFKAFPYNGAYNSTIGENETVCKAGGLVLEYTMDSISGSTVSDTAGSQDGTMSGITLEAQKVGNGAILASTPSITGTLTGDIGTIKEVNFWGAFNPSAYGYVMSLYTYTNFGLQNITIGDPSATDMVFLYTSTAGGALAGKKITITKDTTLRNYSFVFGNNALNDSNFKAFVNNSAESLGSLTTGGSTATPSNNNFTLFKRHTLDQNYITNSKVDQFRFFSRELETYERANLYNGGDGC